MICTWTARHTAASFVLSCFGANVIPTCSGVIAVVGGVSNAARLAKSARLRAAIAIRASLCCLIVATMTSIDSYMRTCESRMTPT